MGTFKRDGKAAIGDGKGCERQGEVIERPWKESCGGGDREGEPERKHRESAEGERAVGYDEKVKKGRAARKKTKLKKAEIQKINKVVEVTVKWKYRLYGVDRRVWRDVEIQNLGYTASCGPGGREMGRVMQVRGKEELEEAELSMEGRAVR